MGYGSHGKFQLYFALKMDKNWEKNNSHQVKAIFCPKVFK